MKHYLNYHNNHKRYRATLAIITAIVVTVGGIVMLYQYPRLAQASSAGPRTATASSDCTDDSSNGGTAAWTSPGNAAAVDATNATVSVDGTVSDYIKCINFGFTTSMIPTGSTILGIVVTLTRSASNTTNGGVTDSAVRLVKAGTIGTTDRSTTTVYPTGLTAEDHGTSTDMWGDTWTVSDVTNSTFGAAIAVTKANGAGQALTANVDAVQITIHYNLPPPVLTQRHYIFQQDDGASVNSNSNNGTTDTALTSVKKGERLNARIQVDNTASTGSDWTSGQFALQYDKSDNSWVNMTNSTELRPGYGLSGSNGDALTSNAAGTCTTGTTFSNGMWMSGSSWNQPLTIAASKCTEVGFVIDTSNATNGTTYRLRLYDQTDGRVLDAYSVYPTLTVVSSGSDTIRASKDHIDRLGTPTSCTDTNWDCVAANGYNAAASQYDGRFNRVAFDGNGNPWFVGEDNQNKKLYVTNYTPGTAASGQCAASWTCTVLTNDGTNEMGVGSVIKFDKSGTPWVAYQDWTRKYLFVAKYVGSGGTGCGSGGSTAWTCTIVNNNGSIGEQMDIAFDSSNTAWVAYDNFSTGDLYVAHYTPGTSASGNCAANWTCTTAATGVGATWNRMVIDSSDTKKIYSNNYTGGKITEYASVASGGNCTGGGGLWNCTDILSGLTASVDRQLDVALDSSGNSWVSYYDDANTALGLAKYVGSGGTGCTSTAWTCSDVDNNVGGATTTGQYNGIDFDQTGMLYISYYDATTNALKVAIRNGGGSGNCTDTNWNCSIVDHISASSGLWSKLVIDPSGVPWVAYQDFTNGDSKVAKLRYPLGEGQLRYKLDNLGYSYISADDTNLDPLPATSYIPIYRFDVVGSTNTANIQPTWVGQSTVAASTDNIKLQVWRGGTTNAWVDMATNSSCAANTDCTIKPTAISTNLSDYYESSGSQYIVRFRVYQVNGSSQAFKSDYFTLTSAQTLTAVFLTPIRSLTAAVCGGAAQVFTLQLQNASGVATTPTDSTVIQITSNSGGYTVYSDSACTNVVSSGNLTFTTSDSSKDFYLIDTATGSHIVTAIKQSGTDSVSTATQSYTVGSVPGVQLKGGTKLQGGTKIQ